MLINAVRLQDLPILSLHIGGELARITELIIDPNPLKLIAVRVDGPVVGTEEAPGSLLPLSSVREFSSAGFIIDSSDDLVEDEDIIHLSKILALNFNLSGLKVITKSGSKLGKVSDYILNTATWDVERLIVQRPVYKSLLDPELIIPRSQIIEVDDYKVIVKDEFAKDKTRATVLAKEFVPNFINPFREPDFAPEPIESAKPIKPAKPSGK